MKSEKLKKLLKQIKKLKKLRKLRKNKKVTRDSTLNMIYRASILHAAHTDVNKLFSHLSNFLFD
jgi:ribonuclease D